MYITGIDPTQGQTSVEGPAFRVGSLGAVVEAPALYTAPMSSSGTTAGQFEGPKVFVYVHATGTISANQFVVIDYDFDAVAITRAAATSGAGKRVAVATCDIESGGYGWVQVYGQAHGLVASGTALGVLLATDNTTAGRVRTAVSATGDFTLPGVNLGALDSTDGTVHLNWPYVGAVV